MDYANFGEFFKKATGYDPYPYQSELAGRDHIPDILNLPTGSGKTDAAVLAIYLWGRVRPQKRKVPRRLVYCLPTRVLVEQIVGKIEGWTRNLEIAERFRVIPMLGGHEPDREYRLHPENEAILVGTQDMLLSRALNRGYAMNIYLWPVEFGLLNNDCFWVVDEVQLMGNGLAATAQLEAFRKKLGTYGIHKTMWMSATANTDWLDTPDFDHCECIVASSTNGADSGSRSNKRLDARNNARKELSYLELAVEKDKYSGKDADAILSKHVDGTLTLVMVNTVKRAQSLFKAIQKTEKDALLVHSRFRRRERNKINTEIKRISGDAPGNMIVVATQAVEAGVDMSARTLITEIAPWPSMIQRFGRCNRRGEHERADIHVIRLNQNAHAPYETGDIRISEERLDARVGQSVSPGSLGGQTDDKNEYDAVLRRQDLVDLFDTVPDLSGNHTDVSGFIRSLETTKDVSVLWREWDASGPPPDHRTRSDEICNVPIYDVEKFAKSNNKVWVRDHISGEWVQKTSPLYPGQEVMIRCKDGGYSKEIGFDLSSHDSVEQVERHANDDDAGTDGNIDADAGGDANDTHDADHQSQSSDWVTLADHTFAVTEEMKKIISEVGTVQDKEEVLSLAAKYHDLGKAHSVFQQTLLKAAGKDTPKGEIWAKCPRKNRHERPNFRHEIVSAIAFRKLNLDLDRPTVDLASYLIASHHGKVRMAIRSLPKKRRNSYVNPDDDYVQGLPTRGHEILKIFLSPKHGSKVSKNKMSVEGIADTVKVDASMAKIGQAGDGSWLQASTGLLEAYGPLRLAYLEALLRAADIRASREGKAD